jgi:hypothetical protein
LVNDQKGGVKFETFPANGEQGPAALTNQKFPKQASEKILNLSRPLFWPSSIYAFNKIPIHLVT